MTPEQKQAAFERFAANTHKHDATDEHMAVCESCRLDYWLARGE